VRALEEARAETEATRAQADATMAQLQAMQALTDTALSHLALDDLLQELLGRVTSVMGVDHVAILLPDADGQHLSVRAARGPLEATASTVQIPVGQGAAGRTALSRAPLIVDDLASAGLDGLHPLLRERLRSYVSVPLLVEEPMDDHAGDRPDSQLVGVLQVGCVVPRHFLQADVLLLQHAADRIALAIDRARLYAAEHDARHQAEAALARALASEAQATERAERLNTILETIADGVVVCDAAGRPLQSNRAYRELNDLDHGPAGFEALTMAERVRLLDVRDATGAPLPFDCLPIERALRGEVVTGPGTDVRMRAFDGRELVVSNSVAPLRDLEGHIVGAVVVLRDMTWRKQLEQEREAARLQAERQAEQLDRIFEAAADGLVVWDAKGNIVRMNPAARRLMGLDAAPPDFAQLPIAERFARYAMRDEQGRPLPPEEWPGVHTLRAGEATASGAEIETEAATDARVIRMRALDGREREIHDTTAPLRDRDGHLVGAVCVMHDVTERNQLAREREAARADELAAREVSRRLEEFVATAAHDLRSPLAAAVGFLDLAQRQTVRLAATAASESPALLPQVGAVRGRLQDADQSTARLIRLLSVLFDTSAVRAGRLELRRAPCDLASLVREQIEALRVAAPERTIHLRAPARGVPIPIEVDIDRIAQVVTNYVTNALKYSPADQPVDVAVAARGNRARVLVCDRGPGLAPAEQTRVWELFHRVPGVAAQSGAQGGSLGLGLHISKAIVEAHGGRVGVESTLGHGSTFWLSLPLASPSSGT
jgi:signal transduction histidine kinase/GAF domain-containing protein